MSDNSAEMACPSACCQILQGGMDELLTREWLITNGLGGYASGTVIGTNTRRYHGLLVASRRPPLEREVLLSGMLEKLILPDGPVELANFEFNHAIHPQGFRYLKEFDYSTAAPRSWVQFVYQVGEIELTKRISMTRGHHTTRIDYRLDAPSDQPVQIDFLPMLACRDFHDLRRRRMGEVFDIDADPRCAVWMADQLDRDLTVALIPHAEEPAQIVRFDQQRDWWYNFRYRVEAQRGQACGEDLFSPGWWRTRLRPGGRIIWSIVANATSLIDAYNLLGMSQDAPSTSPQVDDLTMRELVHAADQVVVRRNRAGGKQSTTILAGYHWFGDWGRDTFIALPGALLCTGRSGEALEVLKTFAEKQRNGLIPNRFSDYGDECSYNSVDASLWFIHAADQYVRATGDEESWRSILAAPCAGVVKAFIEGTDFETRMDEQDGLVACGTPETQITWMDAKNGDVVFTPRHGKPVEINALWYNALCVLADRMAEIDADIAGRCRDLSKRAGATFGPTYWNEREGCLFDGVRGTDIDASIRPNQIFAVSLPHSALSPDRQRSVVTCVHHHLLTPYGLRSLSRTSPNYHGRYEGDGFQRDEAYHQGTVWAWLIGPFIEAYLRVNAYSDEARRHARDMLKPLLDHLGQAGLGSISEIFDGDPPHAPRGCIAQAWSVAEVLRSLKLCQAGPDGLYGDPAGA